MGSISFTLERNEGKVNCASPSSRSYVPRSYRDFCKNLKHVYIPVVCSIQVSCPEHMRGNTLHTHCTYMPSVVKLASSVGRNVPHRPCACVSFLIYLMKYFSPDL